MNFLIGWFKFWRENQFKAGFTDLGGIKRNTEPLHDPSYAIYFFIVVFRMENFGGTFWRENQFKAGLNDLGGIKRNTEPLHDSSYPLYCFFHRLF